MVGPDFISQVTGEGAESLAADPARIPQGSWISAPEGRRISDIARVFRSMKTAASDTSFEALRRILRV
eukprot:10593686-Alexandrium_andersonii.AAC.1